jgi:glycosyltransferase involved in cell wall biosynthesis
VKRAVMLSFRLGAQDGVSVQAATWARSLETLGFTVRRVAGELADGVRAGDVVVPGLAVSAEAEVGPAGQLAPGASPPRVGELERALEGATLVVVENVLSLPLNLPAAEVLTEVLERRLAGGDTTVILHHHDFAWQRANCAHLPESLPPKLPGAVHVTINEFSRHELAERGVEAVTVRNAFDLDAPRGDRDGTRAALGVGASDLLVLQPTRAVPHKNIPAAVELCNALAGLLGDRPVRYWLPGPAEDGYAAGLAEVLARAEVPVLRHHPSTLPVGPGAATMADAYAACDLVVFPSTGGEGFGLPVIEAVWAGRPLAVAGYPALDEIVACGFEFLPVADPAQVAAALGRPDPAVADRNLTLARRHFSLATLTSRLRELLDSGAEARSVHRSSGIPDSSCTDRFGEEAG